MFSTFQLNPVPCPEHPAFIPYLAKAWWRFSNTITGSKLPVLYVPKTCFFFKWSFWE